MAAPYSFRKALNGFNREDVVHHLEYINTRHSNQLNQLRADLETKEQEITRLRPLEALPEQLAQLQLICQGLEADKREYEERIAALEAQLEAERTRQLAIVSRTEEELEAYRRAERLEREARQRADLLREKANGIVQETGVKADAASRRIEEMAQSIAAQLDLLRQEILSGKDVMAQAALSLRQLNPEA